MSRAFVYELNQDQYIRFQDKNTLNELGDLGKTIDVQVKEVGVLAWRFSGTAAGYAWVEQVPEIGYVCVVNVLKKPWWFPWFLVDKGFKKQLV